MRASQTSDLRLYGVAALAFIASTALTVGWCKSMSAMPGMEMPGGWIMTMTWMRSPGQTWLEAGVFADAKQTFCAELRFRKSN